MSDLSFTFHRPFAEQVAAWRIRSQNLIPTDRWTDVWQSGHDRGFMVAGAQKADLLADLAAAIEKSQVQGTTLEEFRRDFRQIVARHGWTGWTGEGSAKGEAWRTKVTYQTNILVGIAAGRRAQLIAGNYTWWVYRHSGAEHPRLHHLALDGIALPPDHPFWRIYFPPNGFFCGCRVFGARTRAGIRRLGGDPDKQLPDGWDRRDPETGQFPGVGRGWDYAPGATVAETVNALKDKLPNLPAPIGAAMFHSWPQKRRDHLAREFAAFVDRSLSSRVEKNYMIVGALKPSWIAEAASRGVQVESAEIAVTDRDIQHSFRGMPYVTAPSRRGDVMQPKADPVDLDWYKRLPDHLLNPDAVLLDRRKKEPALLLLYGAKDSRTKLVIEINTWIKKARQDMNTVQSGRHVSVADILNDIHTGADLIEGDM